MERLEGELGLEILAWVMAWLSAQTGWPQATATLIGAFVAWRGLKAWRRQQVAQRRQQVAEECLMATHAAHEALRAVRSPFIASSELVDASGAEISSSAAILRRLSRQADALSDLRKAALMAEVHFGRTAAAPIRAYFQLFTRVQVAAEMLSHPDAGEYERDFSTGLRRDMTSLGSNDELGREAETRLKEVTVVLRPFILGPGEPDPDAKQG